MEGTKSNYYKETIPKIIKKYKKASEQCLDIIGRKIDDDLADDKLHNVLKAKRMASEDVKFYAKEIENLENEMNGVVEQESKATSDPIVAQRNVRSRFINKN